MEGMMQEMGGEQDAYLEVLQEIKDLMDSKLGDKLKSGGVSIEKVEAELPVTEEMSPEMEKEEPSEDMGLSPEEMDELKNKVYSKV